MAIMKKVCLECKLELDLICFSKHKSNIDGLQQRCKECCKRYVNSNKDKISSYQKQYRQKNKAKAAQYNLFYRISNKEHLSNKKRKYRQDNKQSIAIKKSKYEKIRLVNDPSFKLRKRISLFVRIALNGNKSNLSILKFLPYSMQQLKEHIENQFESWMNWSNWGVYNPNVWDDNDQSTWTWQLDHIIPQSKLPYMSMEDDNFKKCWALSNLRPLAAKQNIIEGSKIRGNYAH